MRSRKSTRLRKSNEIAYSGIAPSDTDELKHWVDFMQLRSDWNLVKSKKEKERLMENINTHY